MFTLLHSSTNQELFEKHVCNHSSHYEKYDDAAHLSYPLKPKYIHCTSLSAMFDSLHSSTNQVVFEKHLCNKSSHYENANDFSLRKGSHHVQPLKLMLSLSAKMNETQGRTLVSPWKMHCTYCGVPKGTSRADATSNSEKNQARSLSRYRITLVWRHQLVS